MKTFLTVLSCLLLSSKSIGQSIEKFSIDFGGQSLFLENIQIVYTIGEINVQEVNVSNIDISEGFINPLDSEMLSIENEFRYDIKIYPNPVKDKIYILTELNIINFKLYDATGRLVLSGKSPEAINVEQFNAGLYVLKTKTEKGEYSEKIIIKPGEN